jgi:cytochrome o ubiquinol oxidase subunit I
MTGSELTRLVLGRLSWDAIPYHEPILVFTFIGVALGGAAVCGALTYFRA